MVKQKLNVWLARDKDGSLWIHQFKPRNQEGSFYNHGHVYTLIPFQLERFFNDFTYENSPKEYTLTLTITPKN